VEFPISGTLRTALCMGNAPRLVIVITCVKLWTAGFLSLNFSDRFSLLDVRNEFDVTKEGSIIINISIKAGVFLRKFSIFYDCVLIAKIRFGIEILIGIERLSVKGILSIRDIWRKLETVNV